MATRSYIGIEKDNGMVEYVYCHWDGHPKNNGAMLYSRYNTEEKVNKLLSYGDMSSLDRTVEKTIFCKRDRSEEWEDCKPDIVDVDIYLSDSHNDMTKAIGDEFRYLFTKENKWIVYDTCLDRKFDLKEYILFTDEEIDALYEEV